MRIVWDEPKRLSNLEKHGFDFAVLTDEWFDDATYFAARDDRLKAVGWFDGVVVAVVVQPLGNEALSIISMRPANAQERKLIR